MPSPFPGMNPYLEQEAAWHDFQISFSVGISKQLNAVLPRGMVARLAVTVYRHRLEMPSPEGLSEPVREWVAALPTYDDERVRRVEVWEIDPWRVVTRIELLCPVMKHVGHHRQRYLRTRREVMQRGIHLVELDLLRGGLRAPSAGATDSDYRIVVNRSATPPSTEVWPVRLRDPLPTIPVPLLPGDADLPLDLMAASHRTYDEAGYEDYIYRRLPDPPLHPEDAKWAQELVGARGVLAAPH